MIDDLIKFTFVNYKKKNNLHLNTMIDDLILDFNKMVLFHKKLLKFQINNRECAKFNNFVYYIFDWYVWQNLPRL